MGIEVVEGWVPGDAAFTGTRSDAVDRRRPAHCTREQMTVTSEGLVTAFSPWALIVPNQL
jgi:hypothetical protein